MSEKARKGSAQELISALKSCPAAVCAWAMGLSHVAIGQGACPRNEDRSYNLADVVQYYRAKAAAAALEARPANAKSDASTLKDEALATKYHIDNGERLGLLLRRDDVNAALTRAMLTLKQTLEGAPHTWVPLLSGKTDLEMKAALDSRMRAALAQCEADLKKALTVGGGDDDEAQSVEEEA